MRISSIPITAFLAGFTFQLISAHPGDNILKPRRTDSILISPDAQPDLPSAQQATAAAATVGLNLSNIQGDIVVGMKKKQELFFFFGITDAATFKSKLGSDIHPLITSATQLLSVDTQPTTAVNIAFSQIGLTALGNTDNLTDADFTAGQANNADNLGDPGTVNWVPGFTNSSIHGVFLLASDTVDNVNAELANIQSILGPSIVEIHSLQGSVRPGAEEGHEHFGFVDGISQPGIDGFTTSPTPGQDVLKAGIFLLKEDGDVQNASRPAWTQDGSFLAFRQLKQLVPEFNKFLADNPVSVPGMNLTSEQGSALLGARMFGRWKSGAPIDLTPFVDDPSLGNDSTRNNNFSFTGEANNQTNCPFSAHIRKTNPRDDLGRTAVDPHRILRSAIPFGPEVSDQEAASNTTSQERGLAFVSYQSDISQGFQFLQKSWADNVGFKQGGVGFDPIIGANQSQSRVSAGLDPTDTTRNITLPFDFIISQGGEYFFSPSLSSIVDTLAV